MCGQNILVASVNRNAVKKMDVPTCPNCHFNDQVGKAVAKSNLGIGEVAFYFLDITKEWTCGRCDLTF